MNTDELRAVVAQWLGQGIALPEIQERLDTEYQHKIKFMDLRLLAADLEHVDWTKFNPVAPTAPVEDVTQVPVAGTSTAEDCAGKTVVTRSKIQRPGYPASGSVTFANGSTADWYVDYQGRPGIENLQGAPPSETDAREFMIELQNVLAGM